MFSHLERPLCDCCDRCHYRSRSHDHSKDWQPFQGAANRVTKLFRGKTLFSGLIHP